MKKNVFRDINKFPKDWGIVVFPISMTRIGNEQSPQKCMKYIERLTSKILVNRVGAHFVYSEGLYMNFEQDVYTTKNNFAKRSVSHMGGMRKLMAKNYKKYQIDSAMSFEAWFQMYLSHKDFFQTYRTVKKLYDSDPQFQKHVASDAKAQGKELTERQVSFFLEEHTFTYLLVNRKLTLSNEFILGREQWVLLAYPGVPPRGQIYLVQKDPLEINSDSNPYKGQYNLENNTFVSFLDYNFGG